MFFYEALFHLTSSRLLLMKELNYSLNLLKSNWIIHQTFVKLQIIILTFEYKSWFCFFEL